VGAKPVPLFVRGSFLMLLRIFYCFFRGLRGLTAEGRFGIGYFFIKEKVSKSHCQRQKTNYDIKYFIAE
jgi:hypothetical protein